MARCAPERGDQQRTGGIEHGIKAFGAVGEERTASTRPRATRVSAHRRSSERRNRSDLHLESRLPKERQDDVAQGVHGEGVHRGLWRDCCKLVEKRLEQANRFWPCWQVSAYLQNSQPRLLWRSRARGAGEHSSPELRSSLAGHACSYAAPAASQRWRRFARSASRAR
jgi:hypothetical protein